MAAKPIRISVGGSMRRGSSAPAAEDMLDQIRDFVCVLHATESACYGNKELRWRVTKVGMQSPFSLALTPDSPIKGNDAETRAARVVATVSSTVNEIINTGKQPCHVSDTAFRRIEKMLKRMTTALATFEADFSGYIDGGRVFVDEAKALEYEQKRELMQDWYESPRWEAGSMEGYTRGIATNKRGDVILKLETRLMGYVVNCFDSGGGLDEIGGLNVQELIGGKRVRVDGLLHYTNLDNVDRIKAENVYIFPQNSELPDPELIVSTNITNGLGAVEYLRRLRNGE